MAQSLLSLRRVFLLTIAMSEPYPCPNVRSSPTNFLVLTCRIFDLLFQNDSLSQ